VIHNATRAIPQRHCCQLGGKACIACCCRPGHFRLRPEWPPTPACPGPITLEPFTKFQEESFNLLQRGPATCPGTCTGRAAAAEPTMRSGGPPQHCARCPARGRGCLVFSKQISRGGERENVPPGAGRGNPLVHARQAVPLTAALPQHRQQHAWAAVGRQPKRAHCCSWAAFRDPALPKRAASYAGCRELQPAARSACALPGVQQVPKVCRWVRL